MYKLYNYITGYSEQLFLLMKIIHVLFISKLVRTNATNVIYIGTVCLRQEELLNISVR